jgi:hypothetical protein
VHRGVPQLLCARVGALVPPGAGRCEQQRGRGGWHGDRRSHRTGSRGGALYPPKASAHEPPPEHTRSPSPLPSLSLSSPVMSSWAQWGSLLADCPRSDAVRQGVEVTITANGRELARSVAVAGGVDPTANVTTVVNDLSARGVALEAGSLVITGAIAVTTELHVGDRVSVAFTGLGEVRIRCAV